jgi:hypothetical protein
MLFNISLDPWRNSGIFGELGLSHELQATLYDRGGARTVLAGAPVSSTRSH